MNRARLERAMVFAELVEANISARSWMKSAERSSLGPSLGSGKTPQKPSEPLNGHEATELLAKVAAGEMASLGTLASVLAAMNRGSDGKGATRKPVFLKRTRPGECGVERN